jgi:hypothetical protein
MAEATWVDMPPVVFATPPETKWQREYRAFVKLLPELLPTHRGQYVAVHDGRVVGHGPDKLDLAMAAYREYGPVDILVRRVAEESERRVVSIPSVRRAPGGAG